MAKRKRLMKALTEEQKQERRDRLAKAREAKGPIEYKTVHEDVSRDENHPLSVYRVKQWISSNKEELARLKQVARKEGYDRQRNNRINILTCYVENMESFLRNGVWLDLFYGENQEFKTKYRVLVPAYDEDGMQKTTTPSQDRESLNVG